MEALEKIFYHDGYQLGMKAIQSGTNSEEIENTLAEMYFAIDDMNNSLFDFAKKHGQNIACKKGCEWCCHQPVFALDYELDYLKKYIEENFPAEDQKVITQRAREKNIKLGSLKNEDLLNTKHPCPLLKDGVCMAYKARPVACRIYLSSNLNSCLKFYNEPEDKNNYPALLNFPMRAGRLMNEGFKAALKAGGIVAKEFRIEEKLK